MFLGIGPEGWTAIFTGLLTVTTVALFGATFGQLWHLRREFNVTHRPEITVHNIASTYGTLTTDEGPRDALTASIWYFNSGSADAVIKEIRCSVWSSPFGELAGNAPASSAEQIERPLHIERIEPSDSRIAVAAFNTLASPGLPIYCLGEIRYENECGTKRITGFYWELPDGGRQWRRVADSPHNYTY